MERLALGRAQLQLTAHVSQAPGVPIALDVNRCVSNLPAPLPPAQQTSRFPHKPTSTQVRVVHVPCRAPVGVARLAARGLAFRLMVMAQGVLAHVAAEAMMSAPQVHMQLAMACVRTA